MARSSTLRAPVAARVATNATASAMLREIVIAPSFDAWRAAARTLLQEGTAPESVAWRDERDAQTSLLALAGSAPRTVAAVASAPATPVTPRHVPREFVKIARAVACHRDATRWDLLYRVLWRLTHGESALLEVATDPDVYRLLGMERAIRRAVHKMHAFVRFRAVETPAESPDGEPAVTYVAWFEPMHPVVERASGLFVRRFASMRWSILTPDQCAHWDGTTLRFTPGVTQDVAPTDDGLEALWQSYYAHIFNPARLSLSTMQAEMPKRYWANLPEASLIPSLAREAPGRVARMIAQSREPAAVIPREFHPVAESSYDAQHDPGVVAARRRAAEVCLHAPEGLMLGGVPVRVGTASWTDPTILKRGVFYPDDVTTPDARLRYYAERFSLVEVDSTYYVPPSRAMAAAWASRSPDNFTFDIKAFALMTGHAADVKRMPDWLRRALPPSVRANTRVYARDLPVGLVDEVWQRFLDALAPLRDANKLGPILLQFPRWFTPTRENAEFLEAARARLGDQPAAVEFRNPEWVTGRVAHRTLDLLERLSFAYVVVDAPQGTGSSMPPLVAVTTPTLAMVRLHGRRADAWEAQHTVVSERYRYLYDRDELAEWADRITALTGRLREGMLDIPDMALANQGVHVVHNNCHANYGTTNADEITELLIEFDQERLAL